MTIFALRPTFPDSICYPKECDSTYPYNDDGSREFLDGVPFLDDETELEITQKEVDDLLVQEKFDDAFLLDVVGGKSWRIIVIYAKKSLFFGKMKRL